MKIKTKKLLSMVLSIVMMCSILPPNVFATQNNYTNSGTDMLTTSLKSTRSLNSNRAMVMGMSGIQNVSQNNVGSSDKIVMGKYGGPRGDDPVEWVRLNDSGLMLSVEKTHADVTFSNNVDDIDAYYSYNSTQLHVAMQSFYVDGLKLTEAEKSIVLDTTLIKDSMHTGATELTGQKFFPLSESEFSRNVQSNSDLARLENDNLWWLRTSVSVKSAKMVTGGGGVVDKRNVNIIGSVRPAFNLDLESVLFTSAATNGKPNFSGAGTTLGVVSATAPTAWKLTLKDNTREFALVGEPTVIGNKVEFNYTGAQAGGNEFISAMIVDDSNNITHYAKIANAAATGTASFMIPNDIGGTVKLKIFNEQTNDNNNTDISSNFVDKTVVLNTLKSVTIEDWVYGSAAKTPSVAYNGAQNGNDPIYEYKLTSEEDVAYETEVPTATGNYTVRASSTGNEGVADKSVTSTFNITKENSQTGVIKVYNSDGETENSTFNYGDTFNVKFTPEINQTSRTLKSISAPKTAELYYGDTKIAEQTDVIEGTPVTFIVNTTDKGIPASAFDGIEKTLTVKWGGDDSLNESMGNTIVILNKKQLSAAVVANQSKVYDGNNNFSTVNLTITASDIEETDDVTVTASGTVKNANAGVGKIVTIANITLDGAQSGYYSLDKADVDVSETVSINKKSIDITAIDIADKLYDSTYTANVIDVEFSGLANDEHLSLDIDYIATNATFTNAEVGANKSATVSIALKDTEKANNYTISNGNNYPTSASINKGESTIGTITTTDREDNEKEEFAYGDTIKVIFTPEIKLNIPELMSEPAPKTAELWFNGVKIASKDNVVEGTAVTFEVDTANRELFPLSSFDGTTKTLTIKWGGDDNLNASLGTTDITLNPKIVGDFYIIGGMKDIDYMYTEAYEEESAELRIISNTPLIISNVEPSIATNTSIVIAEGASNIDITFNGVNVDITTGEALHNIAENATITVMGNNFLKGEYNHVIVSRSLTIAGTGKLILGSGFSGYIAQGTLTIEPNVTFDVIMESFRVDGTGASEGIRYYYNNIVDAINATADSDKGNIITVEKEASINYDKEYTIPENIILVINQEASFNINMDGKLINNGTIINSGMLNILYKSTLDCSEGIITGNTPEINSYDGEIGVFIKMNNNLSSVTLEDWEYGSTASIPTITYVNSETSNGGVVTYNYSTDGIGFSEDMPTNAGNYIIKATSAGGDLVSSKEVTDSFIIEQSTYKDGAISHLVRYNNTSEQTISLENYIPENAGTINAITVTEIVESQIISNKSGDKVTKEAKFTLNDNLSFNNQTATLTATITTQNYKPITVTITISLAEKEVQNLLFTGDFADGEETRIYGDENFIATATGAITDVTYKSDNENVANVDKNTGEVTIVGKGAATISATAEATDVYSESVASYNLVVEQREVTLVWGETDFVYDGTEKLPTADVSNKVEGDIVNVAVIGGQTTKGDYFATANDLTGKDSANYKLPNIKPTKAFSIVQSGTDFGAEGLEADKGIYTYGETITITATPSATGIMPKLFSIAEPQKGQMALYVRTNGIDKQITNPQNATNAKELTFVIDTTDKNLTIGSNVIVAKYIENDNMAGYEETVNIILNQKPLTATIVAGQSKIYDGNGDFKNLNIAITKNEIEASDDVTATANGIVENVNAGSGKRITATSITLNGAHKEYYTLSNDDISGDIEITQASAIGIEQELFVLIGNAKDYTFDLSKLLPTLSDGQNYGAVDYKVASVTSGSGIFTIDPVTSDITDGSLNLKVKNVTTESETATINVWIITDNYEFVDDVVLTVKTVDKTLLNITANMTKRSYNGRPLEYTATPIYYDIVNETEVTDIDVTVEYVGRGNTVYPKSEIAPINAGTYSLIITVSGESANTYIGTTTIGFEIEKANATVTVEDKSAFAGEIKPEFTFTQNGFVNGETISGVAFTENPTVDMNIVGEYTITPNGGFVSGYGIGNYNVTYIAGKLYVTVNTGELQHFIHVVTNFKHGITVNDGTPSSVTKGIEFVSTEVMTAFETAIAQAENIANTATTSTQATDALEAIKAAEVAFRNAIQIGTKSTSSGGSGTGSSSNTTSNEIDSRDEVSIDDIEDIFADKDDLVVHGKNDIEATFDTDAIDTILKEAGTDAKNIEIIIEEADEDMLNDRQQATVGDRPVFNFQVLVDGESITDFEGGRVNITFPYKLKVGEKAENLIIYYIDDEGNIIEKIDVEYDENKEKITFTLAHFSIYMLAYEEISENPFEDVSESDWFYEDVMYVYEKGIMTGAEKTIFAPESTATRAMIWTVLARMEGIDTEGGEEWYSKAMDWSIENGVSDGTNPTENITREQLVTMLFRYNNDTTMTLQTMLSQFEDSDMVSEYAVSAMEWAVAKGIINGKGKILDPQGLATRAEIATIIHRFTMME